MSKKSKNRKSISLSRTLEPVYKALYHETTRNQAINLIKSHQLFDPKSVLKLISEGRVSMAIEILNVEKAYYDKFDLNDMEAIIDALADRLDLGRVGITPDPIKMATAKGKELASHL